MCAEALGTFIGRFKNFRVDGERAMADLHLDNVAKKSPKGDLFSYVIAMANSNPDMFGASISFEIDDYYHYDSENQRVAGEGEKTFVKIKSLLATDVVDDPAANPNGLFSAASFAPDNFAAIATKFLDDNPEIWNHIEANPEIFEPFFHRYAEYSKRKPVNPSEALLSVIDSIISTGEHIRIVCVGEDPAIGDEVYIVQEDGSEVPAPDGDLEISEGELQGKVITVVDGKITAITQREADPEVGPQNPPINDELSPALGAIHEALAAVRAEVVQLRAQFAAFRGKPLVDHTNVHSGDDFGQQSAAGDDKFWRQPWNQGKRK